MRLCQLNTVVQVGGTAKGSGRVSHRSIMEGSGVGLIEGELFGAMILKKFMQEAFFVCKVVDEAVVDVEQT